ncbi:MAG: hypothetical protein IJD17_01965 [Clostridia bacterium]|nr:hypothetical protein [Clostridia bacterium]
MKRFFVWFLVFVMLLSVVSCAKDDTAADPGKPDKSDEVKDDANKEAPEGETLSATLFDLTYDPDVWSFSEEDDLYDGEEYSSLELIIPDPEDEEYYLASVKITADVNSPEGFRDDVYEYGFDAYEYAENGAYELVKVGGVDCLSYEGESWGEGYAYYFGRVENAGATVSVSVRAADLTDSRIDDLIAGLSFKLTDVGNVDAPWPWNGEPYSQTDHEVLAGTLSLESKWIAIEDCIVTRETFDHAVAAVGNTVYLLVEGALKQYSFDGSTLTFEKDIELDGEYEAIWAAEDGSIWLSAFMEPLICIKDGKKVASYDGFDTVSMHPSGSWGINWFSSNVCAKVSIENGTATKTEMIFAEVDIISSLSVDDNYIYVAGSAIDESGHKVFIYDHDGNLKFTLAGEDGEGLGSVTFVSATANGFIAFDGNMRDVYLWNADAAFIAGVDATDLFGTYYPWFCASTLLDDGSILTVMTEDRADESAMELVAYSVKGF